MRGGGGDGGDGDGDGDGGERRADLPVEPGGTQAALTAASRSLREALEEGPTGEDAQSAAPALAAATRLGRLTAEAGLGVGELLSALLVEAAGAGPPSTPARLQVVARAAEAWEEAREERREQWLAFLTHEVKNPLNTVLNALWLLREHPGAPGSPRFLELAERGIRRIEALLKELRALHRVAHQPAPIGPRPSTLPANAEPDR